jgi:peptidyl-prolyl cis-trans isomerase D
MIRTFPLALAATLAATITACDGLSSAFTSHVDVVAKAGDQELTVERLATLMRSGNVPAQPEAARQIADVWTRYQLFAVAAARGDSLFTDTALVDGAMWAMLDQARTRLFYDRIKASQAPFDTAQAQAMFDRGDVYSARHILFSAAREAPEAERAAAKRRAAEVLARTTDANFAALAKQYGSDGTKDNGGDLGVFGKGAMVPEFEQAVAALAPGAIGPLVETQFGYHIVRRNTFPEAREQALQQLAAKHETLAESAYVSALERDAGVTLAPGAAAAVKAAAADPDAKASDRTVLATYKGGSFRVADLVRWFAAFPPQMQVKQQLQQLPDSVAGIFVRNVVRNQLVIRKADSAGVRADSATLAEARNYFRASVEQVWQAVALAPSALAEAAPAAADRRALAAKRVEEYLDKLVKGEVQYALVTEQLAAVLQERYPGRVNATAIPGVVTRVEALAKQADSAAKATQPPSAVPLPGAGGGDSTARP